MNKQYFLPQSTACCQQCRRVIVAAVLFIVCIINDKLFNVWYQFHVKICLYKILVHENVVFNSISYCHVFWHNACQGKYFHARTGGMQHGYTWLIRYLTVIIASARIGKFKDMFLGCTTTNTTVAARSRYTFITCWFIYSSETNVAWLVMLNKT